ncbi:hypothetical protein BDM02DRAFT_63450 [Thelephora ganbajun]|uniref:Uncharacterized protein n=1 Tax=Thelephora ganbajun TaxID=370292 RepID=A0ACB6ZXM2_THEGA|nr:hypothetical protein BDM02DRAFT_63450 [Thelephora ganbajun]
MSDTVCRSVILGFPPNKKINVVWENIRVLGGCSLAPLTPSLSLYLSPLLSISLSLFLSIFLLSFFTLPPYRSTMDSSILDDGLHHQLIPHRDQSTTYGISSSSSVHPQTSLADKFPPLPIDPTIFWHHHPPLPPPPPPDDQMAITFPYSSLPVYSYDTRDDSVPPGVREKRHW